MVDPADLEDPVETFDYIRHELLKMSQMWVVLIEWQTRLEARERQLQKQTARRIHTNRQWGPT